MNPFLYALSLDEHGEDEINSVVGMRLFLNLQCNCILV